MKEVHNKKIRYPLLFNKTKDGYEAISLDFCVVGYGTTKTRTIRNVKFSIQEAIKERSHNHFINKKILNPFVIEYADVEIEITEENGEKTLEFI